MVGIYFVKKGGFNMTFEKRDNYNESSAPRFGCGSCGGCTGDVGAAGNQADFGKQQSAQRQNKGC